MVVDVDIGVHFCITAPLTFWTRFLNGTLFDSLCCSFSWSHLKINYIGENCDNCMLVLTSHNFFILKNQFKNVTKCENIMFIKYTFKHALNDFMNELYVQAINWLIKYCKWFIDSLHDWLVDWWSIEQLVNWWIVWMTILSRWWWALTVNPFKTCSWITNNISHKSKFRMTTTQNVNGCVYIVPQ